MLIVAIDRTYAFNHGSLPKSSGNVVHDEHRREFLSMLLTVVAVTPLPVHAERVEQKDASQKIINQLLPTWQGTSLPGPLSLSDACSSLRVDIAEPFLNMGRWPDPILRHPSAPIPPFVFQNKNELEQLQLVAVALRNTARKEGAVGLAAQQCGVDASMVFIDGVNSAGLSNSRADGRWSDVFDSASNDVFGQGSWRKSRKEISGEGDSNDNFLKWPPIINNNQQSQQVNGMFLVNPRIIHRSPESEMLVWTEQCLVLPPEFRATLLRDAEVTIEYESLEMDIGFSGSFGATKQITLRGELARCAQHEMDHDRGTLIVDHVPLDELLSVGGNPFMAEIENANGLHPTRMQRAYSREISESALLPADEKMVPLAMEKNLGYHARVAQIEHRPWFVQSANALDQEAVIYASPTPTSGPQKDVQRNPSQPVSSVSSPDCDISCLEERKRIIQQRRAMMQQARSNTRRTDVLELSQQRASLHGADFQGLPPKYCSQPGCCP